MHRIKWLLVEWENSNEYPDHPPYGVIHVRSLVEPSSELHTGKLVFVANGSGNIQRAKVVMSSDDRRFLTQQLIAMEEHSQNMGSLDHQNASGPSSTAIAEQADHKPNTYSPSGSSWSQMNDTRSDSDSEASHQNYNVLKRKNVRHLGLPLSRSKSSMSTPNTQFNHTGDSLSRRANHHNMNRKKKHAFVQRSIYSAQPQITSTPFSIVNKSIAMTYDQGTQTGPRFSQIGSRTLPKIEDKVAILEQVIQEMEEKFSIIEATLESWSAGAEQSSLESPEGVMDMTLRELNLNNSRNETVQPDAHLVPNPIGVQPIKRRDSTVDEQSEHEDYNYNDMVGIGTGQTTIPKHILNQVDWTSYTMATRKLLMAVFPRRTLATHSLTGKSSPAFMNKPAKLCLDRVKVNDIVMMVVNHCNVKEGLVRSAITTKCADENKMFRMRQEKIEKRQKNTSDNQTNQENVPPLTM